jgi:hypothetical protein
MKIIIIVCIIIAHGVIGYFMIRQMKQDRKEQRLIWKEMYQYEMENIRRARQKHMVTVPSVKELESWYNLPSKKGVA